MQVAFVGSAFLIALLTLRWAARATHRILLLYASCLVSLAGFEAALWLIPGLIPPTNEAHDSLFRFDEKLGWRMLPRARATIEVRGLYRTTVQTNSAGFRDREPDPEDRAPVLALIGDSFVTNFGVEGPEVFTELVRKNLGGRVSVRNFGVNGYGQVQELLLLDEVLASVRPAMIAVVVYTRNDFDDNLGIFDWNLGYHRPHCWLARDGAVEIEPRVAPPKPRPSFGLAGWLDGFENAIVSTRTHRLLAGVLSCAFCKEGALHLQPPELRYCQRELGSRERDAIQLTTALLTAMKRKCDRYQCIFRVIVAPSLWQVQRRDWDRLATDYRARSQDYDLSLPNRLLAEFCEHNGLACLDLLPALERAASAGETLYYPREQHWNKRGQERVAAAVSAWVAEFARLGQGVAAR